MRVKTSRLFWPRNFRISSLSLGLRGLGFGDRAGVQEVAVNLPVQVIAIGHDHESEIARLFAEDFARIENHRETLARTLRVPEDAELALQLLRGRRNFS